MTRAALGARVLLVGMFALTATSASHPLPFRTAVLLAWGEEAGSDAFLVDLGRALTQSLSQGCFAGVEFVDDPAASQADLLLTVRLSDAHEEVRYEDTIAGSLQSGDPGTEFRRIAEFEVLVHADLAARESGAPVGGKRFVVNVSRRPLVLGEDPLATARAQAIERIVLDLTKAFCRGGAKQESKIRAALAAPPAETASPR